MSRAALSSPTSFDSVSQKAAHTGMSMEARSLCSLGGGGRWNVLGLSTLSKGP